MDLIQKLKYRIETPLPGIETQYEMAPLGRAELIRPEMQFTKAAVLCLLYPRDNNWSMVFIQRTSHEKDKHSAQIAFPGGKMDDKDENLWFTALREAEEEIALNPISVLKIGDLTPLKIPVSKFEVFPYLAYTTETPQFIPEEKEVDQIIEVPVPVLTDNANRKKKKIKLSNGISLPDVPIFNYHDHVIWGATAMMLNEVISMIIE